MTDLDLNKPVQTRDGWPAEILRKDFRANVAYQDAAKPLLVLINHPDGYQFTRCYPLSAKIDGMGAGTDLINVPEKVEGWFRKKGGSWSGPYSSPGGVDGCTWVYLKEAEPPND